MSAVSLSYFKKSGVIDVQCLTEKTILEEKCCQEKQKKQQSYGIKMFQSNSSYGFEYKKTA